MGQAQLSFEWDIGGRPPDRSALLEGNHCLFDSLKGIISDNGLIKSVHGNYGAFGTQENRRKKMITCM